MTRSGAPLQGACGDGKTVTSAGFTQLSDAAAAGDVVAKSRTENPPSDQQECRHSGGKAARKKHLSITL